jgi:hypothetical protein
MLLLERRLPQPARPADPKSEGPGYQQSPFHEWESRVPCGVPLREAPTFASASLSIQVTGDLTSCAHMHLQHFWF